MISQDIFTSDNKILMRNFNCEIHYKDWRMKEGGKSRTSRLSVTAMVEVMKCIRNGTPGRQNLVPAKESDMYVYWRRFMDMSLMEVFM